MNKNRPKLFFLIALFAIAFGIRLIYLSEFHQTNPLFDAIPNSVDHYNFDQAAINFSEGDLLARGPNNSFAPLYKYFLGMIYLLFGRNFYIIYSFQFAMGALTAVLVYLTAKDLFGFRTGIIAFLCFAFYSPQIIYEGVLLRAAFISFFGTLSFYLFSRLNFSLSIPRLIISTLALSLFIQGRPNVIICLPFICVFLYKIFFSLEKKEKIRYWLVFGCTLLLSFAPLLVQCYLVHGKFVFFDASGPNSFISGNLTSYSGVGFEATLMENYRQKNVSGYLPNIQFLWNHIQEDYSGFVKLYFRKLYFFLNDFEAPANISIYLYRDLSLTLQLLLGHFSLFSSFGIIGMLLAFRNKKQTLLLYFYTISLSCSVLIFYNTARYRIPVVPYFIIFSSYSIDLIICRISEKRYKNAVVSLFAALVLFIIFQGPKGLQRIRADDYNNMAIAWNIKRKPEKALYYLDKAISVDSQHFYSHFNKGQHYLSKQNWEKAIFSFEKSLSLKKKHDESKNKLIYALFNLGNQHLNAQRFKNAIDVYSRIRIYDQQNIDVLLNMGVCYANIGKKVEAKNLFESVLKIDPDHSGAKINIDLLK